MKDNKHQFALFVRDLSLSFEKDILVIAEPLLVRRMSSVLRLKKHDTVTLFDREVHAIVTIDSLEKKQISLSVQSWHNNTKHTRSIHILLPVLKRDALESAIYSCVALGAADVQLVVTQKTRKWSGDKELQRLEKISIAAAEQAKNFSFPLISSPEKLEKSITSFKKNACFLFADPEGDKLLSALCSFENKKEYVVLVGPEGDLTTEEKFFLKKQFTFCKLTPTILKSEHAIALIIGAIQLDV